ncbi:MAG: restriction endonuclease subunit S [Paludibacter sp.]|nr:restriction endonuclease subunit S [Paludibacter sp.]
MVEGFKNTEVGVIPNDWEVKQLLENTSLMTNGFVGVSKLHYTDYENGILYIQGYNVEENGFNLHGIKRITNEFHNQHLKSCLREGDLLTIQTGDIGVTTVVPKKLEGSNCHALIITRFKKGIADPLFYSYYFNFSEGRKRLKEIETGSTMKHINVGDMRYLLIPYPTKAEQTAIATALNDADALISSLEKLIAKKKAIKQGAMQELLKPKEGWETKTLGEIGECIIGLTYSPSNVKKEGKLVLRSSNIKGNKLVFDNNVFVDVDVNDRLITRKADILICVRNGSRNLIGKCAFIDGRGVGETFGAFMSIFRSPYNEYIFHVLQSHCIHIQIEETIGATINQLTNKNLNSFVIPFPNTSEQNRIAKILSDMDNEISQLEQKLEKQRQLKQGMMQSLLTGKIRLV